MGGLHVRRSGSIRFGCFRDPAASGSGGADRDHLWSHLSGRSDCEPAMGVTAGIVSLVVLLTGAIMCFFDLQWGLWILLIGGGLAGFASALISRDRKTKGSRS